MNSFHRLRAEYVTGKIEAEEFEQRLDRLLEKDPEAIDRPQRSAVDVIRQHGLSVAAYNAGLDAEKPRTPSDSHGERQFLPGTAAQSQTAARLRWEHQNQLARAVMEAHKPMIWPPPPPDKA